MVTASGRIGTEHEKLVMLQGSRTRAPYGKIAHVLNGLVERHGWEADLEDGTITGAKAGTEPHQCFGQTTQMPGSPT